MKAWKLRAQLGLLSGAFSEEHAQVSLLVQNEDERPVIQSDFM